MRYKCVKTFFPNFEEYGVDCEEGKVYEVNDNNCTILPYNINDTENGSTVMISEQELQQYFVKLERPAELNLSHLAYGVDEAAARKVFETEPKFYAGETVQVRSWGGTTVQEILEARVTYHNRLEEWVWGYRFPEATGLTMRYVPEGYLSRVE